MDLLELFERDTTGRDRDGARQPRRGLRGLLDRLTAALDGDVDDRDEHGDRRTRDRRRRDEADLGFD